jgi:hypothetical protein
MYFGLDIVDSVTDVFMPSECGVHHYLEYSDGVLCSYIVSVYYHICQITIIFVENCDFGFFFINFQSRILKHRDMVVRAFPSSTTAFSFVLEDIIV